MATAGGPTAYTTKVPASRTVAECQTMLAKAGASSVAVHFDADKEPAGLAFQLDTPHGPRGFNLPVNVNGVHTMLKTAYDHGRLHRSGGREPKTFTTRKHARDVAWRVMREWIQANLALVEAEMATLTRVMLPYVIVSNDGTTLAERYEANEAAALESGRPE